MIDFYKVHTEALEATEVYVDDWIAAEIRPGQLKAADIAAQVGLSAHLGNGVSREVSSYMRHRRFVSAIKPYIKLRVAAANIRLGGGTVKESGDLQRALSYEQDAEALMVKLKAIKLQEWELCSIEESALAAAINKAADLMADHA